MKLNSGLNVIVGENNSGKTALIDTIRYTLDTTTAEWTRLSESDFYDSTNTLSIRLKFEGISPDQAHVFIEHLTHELIERTRKSVLYINFMASLTEDLRRGGRFIKTEFRSGESAEGPTVIREIREYLSATYLKPLRDAEAELSSGRNSRLAQILFASTKLREPRNFENLLTNFIAASKEAKENPGIIDSREAINTHFSNLTFEDDKSRFKLAVQILGSKEFSQMSTSEKTRAFQEVLSRLSLVLDEVKARQGLGYNNILGDGIVKLIRF